MFQRNSQYSGSYGENAQPDLKVPKFIETVDDYPMTVTGKVQKLELRKEAEKKYGEK